MTTFVCGHGRTVDEGSKGLPECADDVAALVAPADGEQREQMLRTLIEAPICVPFPLIHEKTVELVGRDVWTHEFARPENLYREARTQQHPVDIEAHVVGSLDQLMGDKPVIVVRPDDLSEGGLG